MLREVAPHGARKNELSTLTELLRKQSTLYVYSKTTGEGVDGPLVWFDIQNIAIRTSDGSVRVIAKENIDYWTYLD